MITCYGCKALAGERDPEEKEILRVYCKLKKKIHVFTCIDKPVGAKPLQKCEGIHTWADYYEARGRIKS